MDNLEPPVTRGRSRSKTPFLRSTCDQEQCAHAGEEGHVHDRKKSPGVKKSPQIETIIEEVVGISSPPTKSTNNEQKSYAISGQRSSKVVTSDYSSADTSPEAGRLISNRGGAVKEQKTIVTETRTVSSSYSTGSSRISGRKATTISSSTANTSNAADALQGKSISTSAYRLGDTGTKQTKEINQNAINSAFEESKIQHSTPIQNVFKTKTPLFQSPDHTDIYNGDVYNHLGYKIYKQAGEYWNKYPKTDYTYSPLSSDRRELAPGIIAMPNMSRKSLEKHGQRVDYMIQRNPERESFIRERYQKTTTRYINSEPEVTKLQKDNYYDSQDEIDFTEDYRRNYRYTTSSARKTTTFDSSWIVRISTFIVTLFSQVTNYFWRSEDENFSYTRLYQEEPKGLFANIKSTISSIFSGIFGFIYKLISSVLYLDTYLLRSSSPDNRRKKRFLLFLLLLLPLLLLAAWYLLEERDQNALIARLQKTVTHSCVTVQSLLPAAVNTISSWSESLKSSLNLPAISISSSSLFVSLSSWRPFSSESSSSSQHNYATITKNMKESLSNDEYQKLINYIDGYVQKLVTDKLAAAEREKLSQKIAENDGGKISKEMSLLISNIVRENIITIMPPATNQEFKLNDDDVQKIAELVRLQVIENLPQKLATDNTVSSDTDRLFTLNQENLEEISKLIKYNIEINNQATYNIIERIDIDELLYRILQSPKLQDYVEQRITENSEKNANIRKQNFALDELNKEITFIKSQLSDKLSENQDLQYSINLLHALQKDWDTKLSSLELNTERKIDSLLAGIDSKIVNFNENQYNVINKQVKLSLVEILGYKNGKNIDDLDLENWIRNTFVAKDMLEERLSKINIELNQNFNYVVDRSGEILMKTVSDKLRVETLKLIEEKEKNQLAIGNGVGPTEEEVRKIVKESIAIYDADKTGLVDYALETAGGQVLSTRCTESYQTKSAQISVFGIPLWYPTNTPRIAISPAVHPGECWAFQGFPGFLVLKLNKMVFVRGFTLEHIPKSLTHSGKIDSAPQKFTVWGLQKENDEDPVKFGQFEYLDNGASLQYFKVQNEEIKRPFDIVELRIESNHGNPLYTCLYRFRVHGSQNLL